jgi:hypothetical protein
MRAQLRSLMEERRPHYEGRHSVIDTNRRTAKGRGRGARARREATMNASAASRHRRRTSRASRSAARVGTRSSSAGLLGQLLFSGAGCAACISAFDSAGRHRIQISTGAWGVPVPRLPRCERARTSLAARCWSASAGRLPPCIVSVGGAIGASRFVAGTWLRRPDHPCPATLSVVDAAVGGKAAINTAGERTSSRLPPTVSSVSGLARDLPPAST